jgi:hypothetical protein
VIAGGGATLGRGPISCSGWPTGAGAGEVVAGREGACGCGLGAGNGLGSGAAVALGVGVNVGMDVGVTVTDGIDGTGGAAGA